MPVGYLPDMFGHVAQMPQILRRAGIGHAVVWRGVPAAIDRHAFRWRAPDGSTVRTEYLVGGYGNGAVPVRRSPTGSPPSVGRYADGQRAVLRRPVAPRDVRHRPRGPLPDAWPIWSSASTRRDDIEVRLETLDDYIALDAAIADRPGPPTRAGLDRASSAPAPGPTC